MRKRFGSPQESPVDPRTGKVAIGDDDDLLVAQPYRDVEEGDRGPTPRGDQD